MVFLFDPEKDHCEPKKTVSALNNNYIQYESIESIEEYINVIRPYLSDIINNHKAQGEWTIHSDNIITKDKTQGEWKIHLTMAINFISSKNDSYETRIIYTQSDNIEIMMSGETEEIIE